MLTKLDGDARGGAALSVREVTGQPIMFASNGEKLEDFDVFHPDRMASRILGMGDMLTLIEQAQKHFDEDEAEAMAAKLAAGNEFTLEDFLDQLQAIRRMGPIGNLLGMMPGMGQMKDAISQIDDKDLDRTAAIIRGMTPAERANPKMINGSRRLRIANGSGVKVSEVNQLVDRFFEARKMMGQMGGMIPGHAQAQRDQVLEEQAQGQAEQGTQRAGRRSRACLPACRRAASRPASPAGRAAGHGRPAPGHGDAGPVQAQAAEEVARSRLHEVWLELVSGSRVVVGSELPDVAAASAVARQWREIAETGGDGFHESQPGSGCIVRASSIIAVKAQRQDKKGVAESLLKVNTRPGIWL